VRPQDTRIFERIAHISKFGFMLAGRRYEFCGSSTNQMRERSAWFFAPDGDVSVDKIWADMGNFTNFKNR
jgi:RNA-dependent RNA polymerase